LGVARGLIAFKRLEHARDFAENSWSKRMSRFLHRSAAMRASLLTLCILASTNLLVACSSNGDACDPGSVCEHDDTGGVNNDSGIVHGDATPPDTGPIFDGTGTCPPIDGGADAGGGPAHPLYPDPRTASVGALGASVHTACVDTSALSSHAHLDALVSELVTGAGLASAKPGDCACEWTLRFQASAPALGADAQKTLTAAGSNPERYVVVTDVASSRPTSLLFAGSERAGLYALRAALAYATTDAADPKAKHPAAVTVVDYPSFGARGIVEGIYGPSGASSLWAPWTVQDRITTIRLMSNLRENVFIYGPKSDDYARANWRTDYPLGGGGEGQAIQVAAHECDKQMITFYWSISPGFAGPAFDFASEAADFAAVTKKIESVRGLGVSRFALFLDDIASSNGTASQHAQLINDLDDYLKKKDPTHHLIVVGRSYAFGPNGYTDTLGASVHSDVDIMWTGTDIEPATMSAGDMKTIDASLKRNVAIWDNWPNSPGSFTGRTGDLYTATNGYYSNPVLNEYPGPANPWSTFAQVLGPVADYLWFAERYDSGSAGSDSYKRWQPLLGSEEKAVAPCPPCGSIAPGWTCTSDKSAIQWCDNSKSCITTVACPGKCILEPPGVPDQCP
jgi:hypothetical protein